MAILLYNNTNKDLSSWIDALKEFKKNLDIRIYPDIRNKDDIRLVVTWPYPEGFWTDFLNLKAISSMGAGVNHILKDKTISQDVDILKLVDKNLNQSMWEYTLSIVMLNIKNIDLYFKQQQKQIWRELPTNNIKNITIGIMGLGNIGSYIATNFVKLGFKVKGYSNSKKSIDNIKTYNANEPIDLFLNEVDILISVLPLTNKTTNIFDKEFFVKMKRGSTFINVGRGEQVVEDDLIEVLDNNQLYSAYLDVFINEPLLKDHKFWYHPKINITPHIASITEPRSVALQIVENYNRIIKQITPLNIVDKNKGY